VCYISLVKKQVFNFTPLKFKSKIIINGVEIKRQYTDRFSFPINLTSNNINYTEVTEDQLTNFFKHGLLKTEYSLNIINLDLGKVESTKAFTFNTFTSKQFTNNYENMFLGKSLKYNSEKQYLNLNNFLYTEQENNLVQSNLFFFKRFYSHYLADTTIKDKVNSSLVDSLIKYKECFYLINPKYKDACFQSINMFYKHEQYFFIASTFL
jgi:hypothetical protein